MIGSLLTAFTTVFLFCTFVEWELPSRWTPEGRLVCAIFSTVLALAIMVIRFPKGPHSVAWF